MKRIGVTQRVTTALYGQPHDCLDQAWADLFAALGAEFLPLPNLDTAPEKIEHYLSAAKLDGFILSGGNDIAGVAEGAKGSQISLRRDPFERHVIAYARANALPLLGVCRGMQFLNIELGGALAQIEGHANTRHKVKKLPGETPALFGDLPTECEVNSYHNFAIPPDGLAPGLTAVAADEAGFIEACFHPAEPIAAIMWHPEREPTLRGNDRTLMSRLFRL
jgi:putative glutamine amidotransferase